MTVDDSVTGSGSAATYWPLVREEVPRILGLGDRDPASLTYGCFDRQYWNYRLIDFCDARLQEVALLLALLYGHELPGNLLFQKQVALEWISATVRFWERQRQRDGSVSEAYPGERSFCATAFTFEAMTEVAFVLGWEPPANWQRTADWLAGADNVEVANQMAAAAAGLANWAVLTGDARYAERARDKVRRVLARQGADGGFCEYGGGDVGYQTVTLGQLVRYQRRSKDDGLDEALRRAIAFVDARVDGDGNHDPAANSRRTQFLYPYALVTLDAAAAGRQRSGLKAGCVVHPGWLDDRYVIPLAIDFLAASLETRRRG